MVERGGRRILLVWLVHILDSQDGKVPVVAEVAQGHAGTGLDSQFIDRLLREVESDGHAEEDAAGEAVVLDHAAR